MTRTDLDEYVKTLPEEEQRRFSLADSFIKETEDTLQDGFRLACLVHDEFWERARRHKIVETGDYCVECEQELLDAVKVTVRLGGPAVCGKCIDRRNQVCRES